MAGYGGQATAGYGGAQPTQAPVEMQPMEQPPVEEVVVDGSSDDAPPPKKQHSEKFRKFKKGFTIGMLVVGVFSGALAWINALKAYEIINKYTNEYSDAAATWQTNPYMDIVLSDTACPQGYDKVATFRWSGLDDHCNCVRNSSESDVQGVCSSEKSGYDCDTMPGLDGFTLNSILPMNTLVCGLSGSTPANKRPSPNAESSPCDTTKTTQCGGDTVGGVVSFLFCYPLETGTPQSSFPCPVTDLVFQDMGIVDDDSSGGSVNGTSVLEQQAEIRRMNLSADAYSCSERTGICAFKTYGNRLNLQSADRDVAPVGVWGFPLINLWSTSGLPCYLDNDGDNDRGYKGRSQGYENAQDDFKRTAATRAGHQGDPNWYSRGYVLKEKDTGCSWSTAPEDPEAGLKSGVDNNPNNWDVRWVTTYKRLEADVLRPYVYNGTWSQSGPLQSSTSPILPQDYIFESNNYFQYMVYETELPWFDAASFADRSEGCPITRDEVIDIVSETDSLNSAQLFLLVILSLSFFIITVIGSYCTIKFAWKDDDGKITKGEEGYETLQRFKYTKYMFKACSYLAIIISIVVALGITAFFVNLVKEYGGQGQYCSDDLTQKSLEKLESIIAEISKKDAVAGLSQIGDFAAELGTSFADKIVELIAGF